jgi:hypothetical protein
MIRDIIADRCRGCGHWPERVAVVDRRRSTWWLLLCACGTRWVLVAASTRSVS